MIFRSPYPRKCAQQLRIGEADVAIIPAIEYQRIDDLVVLPDMAIASKKQVRSLLIIAKKTHRTGKQLCAGWQFAQHSNAYAHPVRGKVEDAPAFFEASPDLDAMLAQADAAL